VFTPGQVTGNRTVYYRSIMPILDVTFRYGYAAASGEVNVTTRPRLVVRSVGQRNGMEVEYWRQTRSLGRVQSTLSPGERLEVPFGVNVTGASATADRIHRRLGDPGETKVSVNVTVTATGTVDGEQVDRTLQYSLPVAIQRGVYEVESGGDARSFTRTERVTVERTPGAVETVGGPLLVAGAVLALLGVAYARREDRIAIGPDERAWLDYRDDRTDFDEWISTVRLPEEAESLPAGRANSLADLVDLAIDTDNAVLESPDEEVYSVVYDGYRYTFEAPPEPGASDVPGGETLDRDPDRGDTTEETDDGEARGDGSAGQEET
jgi:hypothetical protein